jgi:hypothetical protein
MVPGTDPCLLLVLFYLTRYGVDTESVLSRYWVAGWCRALFACTEKTLHLPAITGGALHRFWLGLVRVWVVSWSYQLLQERRRMTEPKANQTRARPLPVP